MFTVRTLKLLALMLLTCFYSLAAHSQTESAAVVPNFELNKLLRLTVKSSINPATLKYIKAGLKKAQDQDFSALLIEINTPGGLVSTTKDIITSIGEANIPTFIWVTPEGASATSAGAIIASAGHLILMNEGTNIGAATPVQMGSDIPKDLRNKAVNDLVALVQSLSAARGRNGELFGKMVSEASSFKSEEALKENLINAIAVDDRDLIEKLGGLTLHLRGTTYKLKVNSPTIVDFEMSWGSSLLNILADPSLAYILLLLGAALIYLELQAPGGFIAGSMGAVCLIIAGISFQVLPLNFGALGLIVLAFIFFVMEIYITSYGLLSLLGLAALISGSLFIYETDNSYLALGLDVIAAAVAAIVLFLLLVGYFLVRDFKKGKEHHFNQAIGSQALIMERLPSPTAGTFVYQIKVEGEIWKATSPTEYSIGSFANITALDSDTLTYRLA